ncbi:uncharacterized protein LOC130591886 [Beta vulgaris subsp. vulgaris]|uniref:uncharacterized protein LOC130591886 n=1 Tax=Beta vulgaris subsp. vulgaris TaxID=3555 RepID=UPI0025488454|nr:uncharacterized protein LOC130591886 [Beta vulgaris subsp. vulgaris]
MEIIVRGAHLCNSICLDKIFGGIVGGSEVTIPTDPEELKKWKIRAERAMYVLAATVEDELLYRIKDAKTPKEAWDTLAALFSKKNDAQLQLLENELLSIQQNNMTVNQYFTKVKTLCEHITKLDPENPITKTRMRRIIMSGVSVKDEEKALFGNKKSNKGGDKICESSNQPGKSNRQSWGFEKGQRIGGFHRGGARQDRQQDEKEGKNQTRRDVVYYNCKKKGHYARDFGQTSDGMLQLRWSMKAEVKSSGMHKHPTQLKRNRSSTWSEVVITANISKLPITHIGKAVVIPLFSNKQVQLDNVYHVSGMTKNLLSVSQLTASGNHVVFGPRDVKVYKTMEGNSSFILEGRRPESVYVMSAQTTYVDKARKNETADLWHACLGHVSYNKLEVTMKKSMLKGLPQLDIKEDIVCVGC